MLNTTVWLILTGLLWSETKQKFKVPTGKWFTLEYYDKEGDVENGIFYMSIQPEVRSININLNNPN